MRTERNRLTHCICALAALLVVLATSSPAGAATLAPGFQESVALRGLVHPTVVRFAPDGRVFVAQHDGRILVFDSLTDSSPDVFADLRSQVHNWMDRGLLGLALDPRFPAVPHVYVLYTYDAPIGGSAPTWGDTCPTPPGPNVDGCVVSSRLSRLTASGNTMTGREEVLINGWCQQFTSHTIGSLAFGPDGMLYVTAGEGASFSRVDYGQTKNPCGDPPGPAGANLTAPSAEGGALRAQDVRTPGDPTGLSGAVLRIDPATGAGVASNPFGSSPDANARRIIAYGLRNPFRAAFRPGTGELWVGDVGWTEWEEIDRIVSPTIATNFGWPCHEGSAPNAGYAAAGLALCDSLYAAGPSAVASPLFAYRHLEPVVAGDGCPTVPSSISGLAFAAAQSGYPARYRGALFFADHSRKCIWTMLPGADGVPSPERVQLLVSGASGPVDLETGPDGDLFYVGFEAGEVRRISYPTPTRPPSAVARATPTAGNAPLTVAFDARASSDPDPGDALTFAWDLDGDGAFDDSASATPVWTYARSGSVTARLRVTDLDGATATDSLTIAVGGAASGLPLPGGAVNTRPTARIELPSGATRWRAGQALSFRGSAADAQQGRLPASALSWRLIVHRCAGRCRARTLRTWAGASAGSFRAPDSPDPSYLELRLTARDAGGLTDSESVRLDPRTVRIRLASTPAGMKLRIGDRTARTPFSVRAVRGSRTSISAPRQRRGGRIYVLSAWSDGRARTHRITVRSARTYRAVFRALPSGANARAAGGAGP